MEVTVPGPQLDGSTHRCTDKQADTALGALLGRVEPRRQGWGHLALVQREVRVHTCAKNFF